MKKNHIGSRFITRIILGATLISVAGSTLAVTGHQSHGNSFIKKMQKHLETVKEDWKCLLDRKKRCTLRQKARMTAELIILAALIAPLLYKGVQWQQWRRREARAGVIEEERRAKEEPLEKGAKELEDALVRQDYDAIQRLLESSDRSQQIIDRTLRNLSRSFSLSLLMNPTGNQAVQKLITDYHPSKEAIGAALINIARNGDALNLVTLLLQQGPALEDINGALFAASGGAIGNDLAIVKELIDQGHASVNYRGPNGNTPLHTAVRQSTWPTHEGSIRRRKNIIHYLLLKDANLHAKNTRGETPWDIASPAAKELIKDEIRRRRASVPLRHIGPIEQGSVEPRPLSEEEIALIISKLPGSERPSLPPSDEKIIEFLRKHGIPTGD